VTVGDRTVSPVGLSNSTGCPAWPSLQWVLGACVPHLRRYDAPLRLPLARRRTLRLSLAPQYLAGFGAFVASLWGSWSGRNPQTTPGPWVTRSPNPGVGQGDKWLSHVPALPRWMHAPLLAPGGGLTARPCAFRTAAFRPLATVGFPLATALRAILSSTTLRIAGLDHAACLLVPSSAVRPLLGVHVEVTSDLLARLCSGGT